MSQISEELKKAIQNIKTGLNIANKHGAYDIDQSVQLMIDLQTVVKAFDDNVKRIDDLKSELDKYIKNI